MYDVVIRCRNERLWLDSFFEALANQTVTPNKIVFVDNGSEDGSAEVAEDAGCMVLGYPRDLPFNYSHALNIGIAECDSQYVLLISAHCILIDNLSIETMLTNFEDVSVSGVFGRQVPTVNSSAVDTRDLLTVFGREKIVYEKYPFFHNAFSLIRKECWENCNFDEGVNGIEDRLWARARADSGRRIIYEPGAAVYHEHGLNQGLSKGRAERVCRALHVLHADDIFEYPPSFISQNDA